MRVEQKSDRGWRVQGAGLFHFFLRSFSVITCILYSLSISIGIVTATVRSLSPAQTRKASIRTRSGDELAALFFFLTIHDDIEGFWDTLAENAIACLRL